LYSGTPDWRELATNWPDGRIKLALTRNLLRIRHEHAELFSHGPYKPLAIQGAHGRHVIAFARQWKNERLIVAIGRLFAPLSGGGRHWPSHWEGTIEAPDDKYTDALGTAPGIQEKNSLALAELFGAIPVAVVHRA
jgi:(1->4)-alpha-D-glucan 1-alpha-D-glucosylmutase